MTGEDQLTILEHLNQEIITCTLCRLSGGRIHAVPGEGPVPARILMIGEAPGKREDELGRPFVGRAGSILEDLLALIGLSREDVFITSINKCRPQGNRDPKDDEITACHPYLVRQIELLKPQVIVPMGRFAAREICRTFGLAEGKISDVHGQVLDARVRHGAVLVLPVYHPAVITHNPNLRPELRDDFKRLKKVLDNL